MPAHFTIVQYVPDPTADERINVGVIAWDKDRVRCQFLADWRRVRAFGAGDIAFVRDFAATLSSRTSAQGSLPLDEKGQIDAGRLEKMVGNWRHAIQFTDPRGSLKDPNSLLAEVAPIFLREPRASHERGRSRRSAAVLAAKVITDAVRKELNSDPTHLVKRDEVLSGRLDKHRFDVVLKNGKAVAAVHALSFEIGEGDYLEREIQATAWTLDDVRQKNANLPLAVFVLRPSGSTNRQGFT